FSWSAYGAYRTPPSHTNLVSSAVPVIVQGDYTFSDANNTGISDAWEQKFFGAVSTDRTQMTDTDGDGATDYAEFIAGTDPNNANSVLALAPPASQPNGSLAFNWPTVPGRAYRLEGSADLVNWT